MKTGNKRKWKSKAKEEMDGKDEHRLTHLRHQGRRTCEKQEWGLPSNIFYREWTAFCMIEERVMVFSV